MEILKEQSKKGQAQLPPEQLYVVQSELLKEHRHPGKLRMSQIKIFLLVLNFNQNVIVKY